MKLGWVGEWKAVSERVGGQASSALQGGKCRECFFRVTSRGCLWPVAAGD